jgi:hypothetical protein
MATVVAILSDRFNRKTSGWVGDLTKTITWLCPLRTFIVFASRTVAYRLIALANIDRWLSSCLYRLITDLIYAFVVNIFPLIIVLCLGFMTIIKVRQAKRRVYSMNMNKISGAIISGQE